MNKYVMWLDLIKDVWESRDPKRSKELVAEEFKYYESPLNDPVKNVSGLYDLWKAVPELQKNIDCTYEILFQDNESAIVNFKVNLDKIDSEKKYVGDRIFHISVNDEGKCIRFVQWREFKEE